ncbi:membrane-bound transcription factor site-2 protease [Venturia canescens]|uniref:membrane-bound transcription factor site-2 protease n=1 Tax=Venturia canescens TaxID=32260 RepID=UPI001C9C66E8|nr:membrane-bound transcription factor site-2 protease [Venturia canescens]
MDAVTLLIVAGFIHCSLFFFNIIFRSCSHYPYLYFLQNTGLEIQTLCVKWSTAAFNRAVVRWGMDRSRFWFLWFNIGAIVSIVLLPIASFLVIKMTIDAWSSVPSNSGGEPVMALELMLPGVNVPFSDIGYYVVTLGLCSIVHEFGHALAASREDVQLFGVGILIAYILPVAYVSMSNEQLASLPVMNQLRVLCAGIWHNIVLSAFAALILSMSSWFWAPLYTYGLGVSVKTITTNSPLLGPTGLMTQDVVYNLNDCSISNSDNWYNCILEAVNHPTPGYCVSQNLVEEYDESAPAKTMPNGVVNCCTPDSESAGSLCFEYIEGPQSAPLQLPPHSCLPARKIIESSHRYCQTSYHCAVQDTHCMRPSLDNTTKVVQLKRKVGKDVLFFGHPADIYRTVEISDWIPKYQFLNPDLPESQALLAKYITIISAGLAVVNVVPCFFFDGHHIVNVLTQSLLRTRVRHKSLRHAIALTITCIGTFVLAMNIPSMFMNK